MHKTKYTFLIALLLAAGTMSRAQLTDPASLQTCSAVKEVQLPAEDRPSAEEAKEMTKCVSESLYYGYGKQADYVAARKCAYLELDRDLKDKAFSGKTILMMVYANGKGAERKLDVALKLACEVEGSPGDWAGRIRQLDMMRKAAPSAPSNNFGICDHSSGPYWYAQCAIQGDKADKIERDQRLETIQRKWDGEEKRAFRSLRAAANRYFKLRATKETDLTVTFEVQEIALLENTFIEMVDQVERGETPDFKEADLRLAEGDLNGAFAHTQSGKTTHWGTVTPDEVKNTQLAWTAYRDAWINFGKVKYPKVTEVSWKTWIDKQRRELLEKFMH